MGQTYFSNIPSIRPQLSGIKVNSRHQNIILFIFNRLLPKNILFHNFTPTLSYKYGPSIYKKLERSLTQEVKALRTSSSEVLQAETG